MELVPPVKVQGLWPAPNVAPVAEKGSSPAPFATGLDRCTVASTTTREEVDAGNPNRVEVHRGIIACKNFYPVSLLYLI